MRELLTSLAEFRTKVGKALESMPFWPDLVRFCAILTAPVVKLAEWVLRKMPWIRKVDWLFETGQLAKRHPVALAFSLGYMLWRGLHTTSLGHIGTDTAVYPFVAIVSGYNPFLGIVCGAAFGIGDLTQKMISPDIYGARGWGDINYWGAMCGYAISYTSVMVMGCFPGVASRAARYGVRLAMKKALDRRTGAAADGAIPLQSAQNSGYPPAWMSNGQLALENIVAAGTSALAAYGWMKNGAQVAETPSFYMRVNPDVSCKHLENTLLSNQAPTAGGAGVLGAGVPLVTGNMGGPGGGGNGSGTGGDGGTSGGGGNEPGGGSGGGSGTSDPGTGGSSGVGPVVAGATGGSGPGSQDATTPDGTKPGPDSPAKDPANYGDRPNVWDPSTDDQQQHWVKDHMIWDPQTLNYRYPKPGELPPPKIDPENPPPYAQANSPDKIPGACLYLYNQYVASQAQAMSASSDLDAQIAAAQADYQDAVDQKLKMFMKLTLQLGFDAGTAVAPYGEQGAGLVGRRIMGAGGESVGQAASRGLSEAAERASQEAQLAEAEVSRLESSLSEVEGTASKLEGEAGTLSSEIDELSKTAQSATQLEEQMSAAESEVGALKSQVADAEKEVEYANNRVQRIQEQKQYISDYDQAQQEYRSYNVEQLDNEADAEFNAKVNQGLAEGPEHNVQVEQEVEQIDGQQKIINDRNRRFYPDGSPQTIDLREFPPEDQAVWQALQNEKNSLNDSRLPTQREEMEARYKPELDQKKQSIMEEYKRRFAATQKAMGKIDPSSDPGFLDAAQKEVSSRQQELSNLQRTQQQASEKLQSLRNQSSQVPQSAADAKNVLSGKQAQLRELQSRQQSVSQQLQETNSQLVDARRVAAQKESDAWSARQSVSDSMPDGQPADDRGTLRQIGDKINSGVRTVAQVLPDFGQESGDEKAKYLAMAQARIDAARAKLDALRGQQYPGMDNLKSLKQQLDACVQEHTYWGGDNANANSASGAGSDPAQS